MDMLSLIGVVIGFAALLGGNVLEGGDWQSLVNGPAALIVFGGTLGAAMLQTPSSHLRRALQLFPLVFKPKKNLLDNNFKSIISWATTARKEGLLGLENLAEKEKVPFARKGLELLVDGSECETIRRALETDMILTEQRDLDAAKFFESMGGYAPTIGIIGAVIGLIHVMSNLADPEQVGPGIAIAFVATIYGVALANLLLLPIAYKIKAAIYQQAQCHEMLIEGIVAIADGESPRAIEQKLEGYLDKR